MFGEAPLIQLYGKGWKQKLFVLSTPLLWLTASASLLSLQCCLSCSLLPLFSANCSSDLANCVPPMIPRPRCTRLASSSHPYSDHLSNARVNQYFQPFIPFSGKLWNSLPSSVFPSAYDLNSFKREVSRHLSHSFGSWIWTLPWTCTSMGFFFIFLSLAACLLHI